MQPDHLFGFFAKEYPSQVTGFGLLKFKIEDFDFDDKQSLPGQHIFSKS
jgi:hypothetical protein